MNPDTFVNNATPYDINGDQFKRQQAKYLILQQQFIDDFPRKKVQQTLENKLGVGSGGGYGRLLQSAKQDLAQRLYVAERKIREV